MSRGWQPCLQEKGHFLSEELFRCVSPISRSIYHHTVQVAVLQTFCTASTVRCPITTAPISLVAAALMMLHDREETSALHFSGSTPTRGNCTVGEQSPLQHTSLGKGSVTCTRPKPWHPSGGWSLAWDQLCCGGRISPCVHPTGIIKWWLPKGRQHLST